MENKKRFKLYKSGKQWCIAAVLFGTFLFAGGQADQLVHADSLNSPETTAAVQQSALNSEKISANEGKSADPQLAVLNQQAGQDQRVSSNYQSTEPKLVDQAKQLAVNEVPEDHTTVNNQINANKGSLDSYNLNQNSDGQVVLHAKGWQASGKSNAQRYRWAIVYDHTAHHEVLRQKVTPVERLDVQRTYPYIVNGLYSGFDLQLILPNDVLTHSLSLVLRYSDNAANGEGQFTNYWFGPLYIDQNNRAYLDHLVTNAADNMVTVSGWHASNAAAVRPYHYIIAYDSTARQEIDRQLVTTGQDRPDVANAYPTIFNAGKSGFSASFKLTPAMLNHNIQFLSRWTNDPAGNGSVIDYWFSPINRANYGWLDAHNLSDGNLVVSGWHATDVSIFAPHHFVIVYDQTAHRQIASANVALQDSDDVARVHGDLRTAGKARFTYSFANLNLQAGHSYSIISRYSQVATGNGDNGRGPYLDYWYPEFTLNQGMKSSIDYFTQSGNTLTIHGWMASNERLNKPYAYVILLKGNHELDRQRVDFKDRSDVASTYPDLYDSLHSGFETSFDLTNAPDGDMQFVLRFSDDSKRGEGNYISYYSRFYTSNAGYFDRLDVSSNRLQITGWHAALSSPTMPYQHVIIVDAESRHEYGRWAINGYSRPDIQRIYPWMPGSETAGFSLSVDNTSFNHHNILVIHRYSDSPDGEGHYVDISELVHVHSWYTIGRATYHLNDNQQLDYVLNDAVNLNQNPELPTGCEMTAVTMMLQYAGVNVTKQKVANDTPRSGNPYAGFVGNPYSNYGYGLWVAPSGIAPVVKRYLGNAWNMTGASLDQLKNQLINRHLVVVWQAHMHGFGTHAITLTGFDGGGFFYNDPWTGQKNAHMSYGTFDYNWRTDIASRGALSYL